MKKNIFILFSIVCAALLLFIFWQPKQIQPTETILSATTDFYTITIPLIDEPKDTARILSTYEKNLFEAKKQEWRVGGEAYASEQSIAQSFPDRKSTLRIYNSGRKNIRCYF